MLAGDKPRTVDEAELAGWDGLELNCGTCRFLTTIPWHRIRRRSGYRKLDEIKERLRCQRCGTKPLHVWLHRDVRPHLLGPPQSERMEL